MADTYLKLVNTGITKDLSKKLGLPRPAILRRFDPAKPLVPGPVLILGKGESADDLAQLLLSWDQDVRRHAMPKEKLGAILIVLDDAAAPEDLGEPTLAAGHPFAATGGRIVASLAKMLHEKGSGRGLISICAAGGQGLVAILEAR